MNRIGAAIRLVVVSLAIVFAVTVVGGSVSWAQTAPTTAPTVPPPADPKKQEEEAKKQEEAKKAEAKKKEEDARKQAEEAEKKAAIAARGILLVLGIAILLGFLKWLDGRFPLLRDRLPPEAVLADGERPPYSLGRCQMVLWTAIVVVSAVVVFFFGERPAGDIVLINGTAAILIGISGSAGLLADFVDATKDNQFVANGGQRQVGTRAAPGASWRFARSSKSTNFWTDILEDDNGNSLHRVQMVLFTLILGVVFCWEVAGKGAMPAFAEATLALIGISGGAYVGFKLPGATR